MKEEKQTWEKLRDDYCNSKLDAFIVNKIVETALEEKPIKKNNQLVTDLVHDLRIKRYIINRYLSDPRKYKDLYGESEYNQRINKFKVEIKKIEAELKDLGFIPEEN